jgi:hypothetical protein
MNKATWWLIYQEGYDTPAIFNACDLKISKENDGAAMLINNDHIMHVDKKIIRIVEQRRDYYHKCLKACRKPRKAQRLETGNPARVKA